MTILPTMIVCSNLGTPLAKIQTFQPGPDGNTIINTASIGPETQAQIVTLLESMPAGVSNGQ